VLANFYGVFVQIVEERIEMMRLWLRRKSAGGDEVEAAIVAEIVAGVIADIGVGNADAVAREPVVRGQATKPCVAAAVLENGEVVASTPAAAVLACIQAAADRMTPSLARGLDG